jgi:hypothetical protein
MGGHWCWAPDTLAAWRTGAGPTAVSKTKCAPAGWVRSVREPGLSLWRPAALRPVERGGDLLEGELAGSDRDHAALERGQLDALAVRLDADVGDDAAAAGDQFDVSVGEQVWPAVALSLAFPLSEDVDVDVGCLLNQAGHEGSAQQFLPPWPQ